MTECIQLAGGKVYDPTNGIDGEVRDIYVEQGRIVATPSSTPRRINVSGMVVMPGGVDIHCHIAGPKINLARKLQPEDHRRDPHPGTEHTRSGVGGNVPSTFATGYRYATMGYTTAMEAAVTPIAARHAIEELHDTPVIDKGFYVLLGNNIFLQQLIRDGRKEEFRHAVAWWVNAAKAYTTKLVNPGCDEPWKGKKNSDVKHIDEKSDFIEVSPRQVIDAFVDTVNELGLPPPAPYPLQQPGPQRQFRDDP